MSEPTEDFAAMFEASLQAKRIEKGQTIDGTIVAIGPEVAFVDVGGKGEAMIEIDELKDAGGTARHRHLRSCQARASRERSSATRSSACSCSWRRAHRSHPTERDRRCQGSGCP